MLFGDNDNEDGYVPLSAGAAATWHLHRITRSQLNLCGLSLSSPPFLLRYKPVLSVSLTSSRQNCNLTANFRFIFLTTCFDDLRPVHVVVLIMVLVMVNGNGDDECNVKYIFSGQARCRRTRAAKSNR